MMGLSEAPGASLGGAGELTAEERSQLRSVSIALHKAARPLAFEAWRSSDGHSLHGVELRVCRAYVWAMFSGEDVLRAVGAATFPTRADAAEFSDLEHARANRCAIIAFEARARREWLDAQRVNLPVREAPFLTRCAA